MKSFQKKGYWPGEQLAPGDSYGHPALLYLQSQAQGTFLSVPPHKSWATCTHIRRPKNPTGLTKHDTVLHKLLSLGRLEGNKRVTVTHHIA